MKNAKREKKDKKEKYQKAKEIIYEIGEGLLAGVTNAIIYEIVYTVMPGRYWTWGWKTDRFCEKVNYFTIKRALYNASKKGYLKKEKGGWIATEAGKKRLEEIIPQFNKKRDWDGRVYLYTYDIPNEKKRDRDLLRHYLHRLGAAMLQESVYISAFDLRGALADFIKERQMEAEIIASTIGKDGMIGEKGLEALLQRLYHLDELNKHYEEFIRQYEKSKNPDKWQLNIAYHSILEDDPQLPYSLMDNNYLGAKAHELHLSLSLNQG